MKLRNKLAAITAAAMLAFTGVGFASWAFTNAVEQENETAGTPKITCAVELNSDFNLYNTANDAQLTSIYLICDAPASGLNALAGNGVYWSTTADSSAYSNKIDSVYIQGTLNYDQYDIDDINTVTVQFMTGANYDLTNGTYVEFANATLPANATVSVANNAVVKSDDFALPVPSYNSGVNTTNFNSVAQVANITDGLSGLNIAYKAQIIAKA